MQLEIVRLFKSFDKNTFTEISNDFRTVCKKRHIWGHLGNEEGMGEPHLAHDKVMFNEKLDRGYRIKERAFVYKEHEEPTYGEYNKDGILTPASKYAIHLPTNASYREAIYIYAYLVKMHMGRAVFIRTDSIDKQGWHNADASVLETIGQALVREDFTEVVA